MDQFEAAKTGNLDWFLEHEKNGTLPDLSKLNGYEWFPYELVGMYGHLHLIKYFFEECSQKKMIDIHIKSNSVTQWSACSGHLHIIKYLLEECPQKDRIDLVAEINYAVREAATSGHLDVVRYLVEECPQREMVDITADDNYAVRLAARNGHLEVAKYLKPIIKMTETVGHENWRTCQTLLSDAEKTGTISFSDGLSVLKGFSPELLEQLLSTDTGQRQLLDYLEQQGSQPLHSENVSVFQL